MFRKIVAASFVGLASAHMHAHKGDDNPSSSVFQSVSARVSALEERLSEMEVENKQKLAARLGKYESRLKEQKADNTKLAIDNVKLAEDEEKLRKDNKALQQRAKELQADNAAWERDWQSLQANLSTALELSGHTLTDIDQDRKSKDLQVLAELQEHDDQTQKKMAHAHRLNEIAMPSTVSDMSFDFTGQMSLLAVKAAPNPRSMLKILDAGFEDLHKEYKDSEAALDAKYAGLFSKERAKHEELEDEARALNANIRTASALKRRLQDAVAHLEASNKELEKKGSSIRMYAQRLGIRALPQRHADANSEAKNPSVPKSAATSQLRKTSPSKIDEADSDDDADTARELRNVDTPRDVKRAFLKWLSSSR